MTVYATRLTNGTDSRERMRHTDALGLFPGGVGVARGGLRNDGGGAVTVNAGTMTVAVAPFMAYVDGGVSDAQGGYTFVSDAAETLTVSPGHASLSRTDVVIAEVRDTAHDGSGSTDARVRILEGTAGAGTPALPINAVALRNITVPAGLSAGTGGLASGNLGTDRRTYTTGLGGVLTVASQSERDALPAINGPMVYRTDTDRLEYRAATGWEELDAHSDESVPLLGDVTGSVTAKVRGRSVVVDISVTCPTGAVAFGGIATLPASLRVPVNGVVWNNNTSTAFGMYVDTADGAIRSRVAIGAGHLLLGQLVLPL